MVKQNQFLKSGFFSRHEKENGSHKKIAFGKKYILPKNEKKGNSVFVATGLLKYNQLNT